MPAASWTNWPTGDGDEGEEGAPESGVPAGSTYFPSSMGMSFVVAADTKEIVVEAEWGQYLRIKSATQKKKDGSPANVWKRKPVIVEPNDSCRSRTAILSLRPLHPDHPLVLLQGRMRLTADGWVVTLFMVNQQEERTRRGEPKDEVWVFQPKMRVRGTEGQPIFVQRKGRKGRSFQDGPTDAGRNRDAGDALSTPARVRCRAWHLGARHAAGTVGGTCHPGGDRMGADVRGATADPRSAADDENLAGLTLDMKALAELPKEELISSLRHIETAYGVWIKAEAGQADPARARSWKAMKRLPSER